MRVMRAIPRIAAATVAALSFAALSAPTAAVAQERQIVIGQLQFNPNAHPLIQVNNTKRIMMGFAQRPITGFDEAGANVCVLCETLPSLSTGLAKIVKRPDGSEGMEVTIRLKDGLKWGDGKPVTARDIAFTWRMASDPAMGVSNYNLWTRADRVDVVDDRTALLHLPRVITGYDAWDHVIPEHLEGPVYAQNPTGDAYVKQTLFNREPTNPGLWNGPFVFTEYRPGTRIILQRNPNWPGPGPHLGRIVLSYRDNSAALVQNLLAGAIDAVPVSPGGISFAQMLDLRRQQPTRFDYHVAPGANLERIALNLDNPILADVRVRRALLTAIDRKAITDALFDGLQEVAHGPLPPGDVGYSDDFVRHPFDLAKARAMLAEAGWRPGPDGICVDGAGRRLTFEFVTTAGNRTREQIAQVLQSQFKAACVETVNNFVQLAEFNGRMLRRRAFTGMVMGSIDFPPSASPRIVYGTDQIPSEANGWTGNNFSGYRNPAMDAAIARVEGALEEPAMKAAWAEIQKIHAEDLPLLPLYFYARAYVAIKAIKDFRADTVDPLTFWAESWRRE
jgi:peptide/nickel transport system substrate-binding protein